MGFESGLLYRLPCFVAGNMLTPFIFICIDDEFTDSKIFQCHVYMKQIIWEDILVHVEFELELDMILIVHYSHSC